MVLNTGPLDWESSALTTRPLLRISFVLVCHSYVIRISLLCAYVVRMSLICTHMLSLCHSYVLVCHPYVPCMYWYVTRMYSYVLVCQLYVTRMYSYVIRMSLVCSFTMNLQGMAFIKQVFSDHNLMSPKNQTLILNVK